MFVRDALTATMLMQQNATSSLGDAMDDAAADDSADPLLSQLHQIALVIVSLRSQANSLLANVGNANADVDMDLLTRLMQQIDVQVQSFRAIAAQRNAQNPYQLTPYDTAILDIGTWAQGVLQALPGAVSAIPNALVNAAGNIIGNAGSAVLGASVPWLIGGGLVLLFVLQAEKSRTYRKAVA